MPSLDNFTKQGEPNLDAAIQQASLLCCLYYNQRESAEAICRIDGSLTEVLVWNFRRGEPMPSHAIIRQGRRYFVIIEGTMGSGQWSSNLRGVGGRQYLDEVSVVHGFFEDCADEVWPILDAVLPPTLTDERIFISGHSLGGATAFLLALNIAQRGLGHRVEVMTFGEPRSLSNAYTGPTFSQHWRFATRGDTFSSAPPRATSAIVRSKEESEDRSATRIRYWIKQFQKRAAILNFQGIDRLWTHYGTLIYLAEGQGMVNTGRAEPDVAILDGPTFVASRPVENHSILNYLSLLQRQTARQDSNKSSTNVYEIGRAAFFQQGADPQFVVPNYPDYVRLPGLNELLVPVDPPEIDATNLGSLALLALTSTGVEVTNRSNIHERETLMIALKTVWKMTFFLTDTELGKSHTMYWNGGVSTIQQARDVAVALINRRRNMLGNFRTNAASDAVNLPDKGAAVYTHVRISDAAQPRYGQLFKLPHDSSHGWGTDTGNSIGDFFSVALAVTLNAESEAGGPRIRHTETFVGQQDEVVSGGVLFMNGAVGYSPLNSFQAVMNDYLGYITLSGNKLGAVGQDPAVRKKLFTTWVPDVDGFATGTCAGHGYANNDLVRVTESKVAGFNGVYRVKFVDANRVTLLGKIVTNATVPLTAQLRLKETADGVRQIVFYQFVRPPAGFDLANDVRVVKRNIAKRFTTVSFSKKGKRR